MVSRRVDKCLQLWRNASVASARESGLMLKKNGNLKVRQDVKRSILMSGKFPYIFKKLRDSTSS